MQSLRSVLIDQFASAIWDWAEDDGTERNRDAARETEREGEDSRDYVAIGHDRVSGFQSGAFASIRERFDAGRRS